MEADLCPGMGGGPFFGAFLATFAFGGGQSPSFWKVSNGNLDYFTI